MNDVDFVLLLDYIAAVKKAVEVTLLNQKFTVRTEADGDHVAKIKTYVDEKLGEVASQAKLTPPLNVALLTCLNIADDFFRLKEVRFQNMAKAEKRIRDLIQMIGS